MRLKIKENRTKRSMKKRLSFFWNNIKREEKMYKKVLSFNIKWSHQHINNKKNFFMIIMFLKQT